MAIVVPRDAAGSPLHPPPTVCNAREQNVNESERQRAELSGPTHATQRKRTERHHARAALPRCHLRLAQGEIVPLRAEPVV